MSDVWRTYVLDKINETNLPLIIGKGRGVGDVDSYKEEFAKVIKKIYDKLLDPLKKQNEFVPFVSIHFSSPFLKKWVRFIDEERIKTYQDPEQTQSYLAYEFLRDSYENLPRMSNFTIIDEVVKENLTFFTKKDNDFNYDGIQLRVLDEIWRQSRSFLRAEWFTDFLKTGFPPEIPNEDINAVEEFIRNSFGALSVMHGGKRLIEYIKGVFNEAMSIKMVLCMFLSTYFWAIDLYPNNKLKNFCVFTVPVSYYKKDVLPERLGTVSFCWSKQKLNLQHFDLLKSKAITLIDVLLQMELLEGKGMRWDVLASEDIIRQSCYISKEVIGRINRIPKWLKDKIESPFKDTYFTETFEEKYKYVAASPKIYDLIEEIYSKVKDLRKNDQEKKILVLTLYSKPGAGKESLAQIAHYMSLKSPLVFPSIPTCFESTDIDRMLNKKNNISEKLHNEVFEYKDNSIKVKSGSVAGIGSFYVKNCSLFENKDDLRKDLFVDIGSRKDIGNLIAAYLLCGTLFLDEFNTIDSRLADEFLRIFDEPYEVSIGNGQIVQLNKLLIIIGTNNTREELFEKKINAAVISRICRHYLEIPSLKERPEDIALFVNKYFYDCLNEEFHIKRIELNAMRLLCNSQWETNYRELQGCLDFIWNWRCQCGMKSPVLTFDEVLYAFQKRNMLIGGRTPKK